MTDDESIKKSHAAAAKRTPVANSTKGYCRESAAPQERHLPHCRAKLNKGISSNQANSLLQDWQRERPLKNDSPRFQRKITTFKKLPTTSPKRKTDAKIKNITLFRMLFYIKKNINILYNQEIKPNSAIYPRLPYIFG